MMQIRSGLELRNTVNDLTLFFYAFDVIFFIECKFKYLDAMNTQ